MRAVEAGICIASSGYELPGDGKCERRLVVRYAVSVLHYDVPITLLGELRRVGSRQRMKGIDYKMDTN